MKYAFSVKNNFVTFKPFDGILHFVGKVVDCTSKEAPEIAERIKGEIAVDRAEKFITSHFSSLSMVTLLDKFYTAKAEGNLAGYPKLVAVYEWANKVKSDALSGAMGFDTPPFSLVEVLSETPSGIN